MSDLRKIPGVGKNIEEDLIRIGIRRIEDLRGKDPQELYRLDCLQKGFQKTGANYMYFAAPFITQNTSSLRCKS